MDSRNLTFSVVQDRSKVQTFTPTVFTMLNQQQPTAEKSVQTHNSSTSSTLLVSNHPENAATEVANTLVSMATGRQRAPTGVKQLSVISVPNQSSSSSSPSASTLPVLSLAEYTTSRGVPTAIALANQAKLTARKEGDLHPMNDENEMSTEEFQDAPTTSNGSAKTRRNKNNKGGSTSKNYKQATVEPIQYGPIVVKPRKHVAPTLANGRRSKDDPLPPDEDVKRKQRRDRNKNAAAKCRKKRNELREELEKTEQDLTERQRMLEQSVQTLAERKNQLEYLMHRHPCTRKSSLPIVTTNTHHIAKTDLKTIPGTMNTVDSANNTINTKRVTINFTNPQDFLAVAPLTRASSTVESPSSNVPVITIHILPEVAQALLGSTTLDRAKLVELLQQANANHAASTSTNQGASDSMLTNTSSNNHS